MTRLDDLPLDQRAALSLLLAQRKSYAEVAALLGIPERSVADRAQAALAVLAPPLARQLTPDERAAIGDYLLGQRGAGVAGSLQTRELLAASEPARGWAQALAHELSPLGETAPIPPPTATPPVEAQPPTPTPEAQTAVPPAARRGPGPARAPAAAPAGAGLGAGAVTFPPPAAREPARPPRSGPSPRVSRTGGAVLLGLLAAGVIVGILFAVGVLGGGGSSSAKKHAPAVAAASKTGTGPAIDARLPLTDPNGSKSRAGLVQILSEGGKRAFYTVAEGLPPTHGFFYALWLYNSPSSSVPLGKAPAVGSNKRLEGGGLLPENAGEFKEILLTRETSTRASHPGTIVLSGPFSLSG